ncbi:MAG: hypothetical protein WAU70_17960 [Flavobacteriales bacterium]
MSTTEELREAIEWGRRMIIEMASGFGPAVAWSDDEVAAHESRMKESMVFDNEFAFTIDTRICDYTFRHGVQRALGLRDDISMGEFMERMHPDYFIMFQRWAGAAYKTTQRFKEKSKPLGQSYRIMIPLKSSDGKYLQVIQCSTMLQADKDGNMLKYFNRYYISHRAWDYAPLRPDFFEGRDPNEEWSLSMNMEVAKGISENLFKASEERVLRRYHDLTIRMNGGSEPTGDWVQPKLEDVAVELDTNLENIRHYRKEILRKSNLYLEQSFEKLDQLYVELRRLGYFEDRPTKAA